VRLGAETRSQSRPSRPGRGGPAGVWRGRAWPDGSASLPALPARKA